MQTAQPSSDISLADLAARISALAGGDADRRQDGLDLLAVAAGLKPLCLIGRGTGDPGWGTIWNAPVVTGAIWEPEGDLPAWYLAATARRRSTYRVTYLCNGPATQKAAEALCRLSRVSAEAEAALLGYPLCCVAHHHRQVLRAEKEIATRATRLASGDEPRRVRLVETGALSVPCPPIRPAPCTSINMCDACARSDESPAALLSNRYRALAAAAGYEVP